MQSSHEYPLLIAKKGPLDGHRWSLNSPMVIGREPHCDIVIDDRQVSRYHAKFTPTIEGVMLEDMDSKNGTHCNGILVENPVVLKDGDAVQISLVQQFIFFTSDATIPLSDAVEQGYRLRLDDRSRRVWILSKQLVPPLSALQFQLLQILYENIGQVIRRQDLVSSVWGESQSAGVTDQALDALIRRLRERLAELDESHEYIVTVRGHGIRLDNPNVIES
ncbi:MAG TPA: FHA domain-containing protein [Anaerolineales bacterium]|nr:FHA domain-containing protein [Anaerolineales bacterium]